MQWFSGSTTKLLSDWSFQDSPLWADYQVLGPNFGAVSVLLGVKDVLPVILGSRGCATHLRFTKLAWGIDYTLEPRPLPFIELKKSDIVRGKYQVSENQISGFQKIIKRVNPNLIAIMSNDDAILSCADLNPVKKQFEKLFGIPTIIVEVSSISSANQWIGYDKGLGALYDLFENEEVEKKRGVNLVGWKWPSRERNHDIGACISLLNELDLPVNHVIPGGCSVDDFRDSLGSQANVLWCPSYIGDTLKKLEVEKGIKIAGYTPPYGFQGTMDWIKELSIAIEDSTLLLKASTLLQDSIQDITSIKKIVEGKKAFISGGPGRLPGLLAIMADLGVDVKAAALYWPHSSSKHTLEKVVNRLPNLPDKILVGPSLYEIDEIASTYKLDFWMGGFQEQHACKRNGIPFIPTTVYTASHQCFEGVKNVGIKVKKALEGYDFVASSFRAVEDLM